MRNTFFAPLTIAFSLFLMVSACRPTQVVRVNQPAGKHTPPGQAKKIYGHQSAKAFAPGQQKKYGTVAYPKGKVGTPGYDKPGKGNKKKGKKK